MEKFTIPTVFSRKRNNARATLAFGLLLLMSCDPAIDSDPTFTDNQASAPTPTDASTDSDTDHTDNEVAATQGGGDDYWAELAQSYPPFVKPPGLGAATPIEEYVNLGNWDTTFDWPLIATGAANLPDGRIVAWSSQEVDNFGGKIESTYGTIYDPITGTFEDTPNSSHDMFCAGVSLLEDGRIFVAGGGKTVSSTSIFDNEEFTEIEPMAMTRWYPTSTTLASGQVLTSLGTNAAPYPEIWTDGKGWSLLPEIDMQSILDSENVVHNDWYPALNVAPDGSLFHPGHMPGMLSVYMNQEDTITDHGALDDAGVSRLYNTTIMYDIGKMLIAGGGAGENSTNEALTVDLNGPTPVVTPTEPMTHVRSMQNSVVLPNGEVLVIGGNTSGIQFSDEGTVLEPEMWNPETGTWRELALHDKPRNYHSVALLMKDARVLAAGGGLCGACATNHQNGEVYSPPYLFNTDGTPATRPTISGGDDTAIAGDNIVLTGSDDIVEFNMVRLVAITHHHTTDQRFVPIDSTKTGTGEYQLTLNSNANVLLPGYYWVFGLDANGTPTEGHTIQITVSEENQPGSDIDTSPNVAFEYYEESWSPWILPDFDSLTPVKTGTQSDFSLVSKERNNWYGFRFRGSINVPVTGQYTFFLASDDGSKLLINDQLVVDHDGPHGLESEVQGSANLTAGQHDIEVQFFEITGGDALLAQWQGPTINKRPISAFDLGSPLPESNFVNSNPGPEIPGKVSYRYFEGSWTKLPNFDNETIIKEGEVSGFDLSPRQKDNFYGFEFTANLTIATAGDYTFYLRSDDGSLLSINGITVVNNDGLHWFKEESGTIALSAGTHKLTVEYFEHAGGDDLEVNWSGPGFGKQAIASSALASNGSIDTTTGGSTGDTDETGGTDGDQGTDTEGTGGNDTMIVTTPGMVNYKYFEGTWTKLPVFDNLAPVKVGESAGFNLNERLQDDNYGMQFSAKLTITNAGDYTLFTKSDDGSRLYINDQLIVDNDGLHAPIEKQGTVSLSAGTHEIIVEFFERDRGDSLTVSWQGPDIPKQIIPLSALASTTIVPVDNGGGDGGSTAGSSTDGSSTDGTDTDGTTGGGILTGDALVNYEYYEGQWTKLPEFDQLTPVSTGQQSDFAVSAQQIDDHFGFRYTTNLLVEEDALYTFFLKSDDGSRLTIDGQVVIDNDGLHWKREYNGSANLTAGSHTLVIEYFEGTGGTTLELEWSSSSMTRQPVHNASLSSIPFSSGGTDNTNTDGSNNSGSTDGGGDGGIDTTALTPSDLQYAYYEGSWTTLPNFNLLFPADTGTIAQFSLPPSNGVLFYGIKFTGQILVSESDVYTFYTASNDGSQLFINDQLVVDNNGRHGVLEQQGSIQLEPGLHDIEVTYFQFGGTEALNVFWSSSNFSKKIIESSVLFEP